MPSPDAAALLAEIDKLARALPCLAQKRRLAVVRAQVQQLVHEARAVEKARAPALPS